MTAPDRSVADDLRTQPLLTALLVVAVAFAFFVGLGAVPLFDLDEGAFTEATREMLQRGDYISTFLNGQPRYDKPVLIYWLQAVSVLAFGETEFAFRLRSAPPSGSRSCSCSSGDCAVSRRACLPRGSRPRPQASPSSGGPRSPMRF